MLVFDISFQSLGGELYQYPSLLSLLIEKPRCMVRGINN